jgi:hypothetical protein
MVYIVLPQFKAPGASLVVLAVVLLPVFDIENSELFFVFYRSILYVAAILISCYPQRTFPSTLMILEWQIL